MPQVTHNPCNLFAKPGEPTPKCRAQQGHQQLTCFGLQPDWTGNMRLLNVNTFEIRSFEKQVSDVDFPRYAILSHTWDDKEITFQDFARIRDIRTTPAFRKIAGCCIQAREDGLSWVWIDTCCIDKTSSAELSEGVAINSMYKWYEAASVCYVYIGDLDSKKVNFYTANLAEATGIPAAVLRLTTTRLSVPIADRMSWVSGRETSRVEDHAYCLLGIFDVNMPLLYGEGSRAFTRLQAEIMRTTNDDTIFLGGLVEPFKKHAFEREGSLMLKASWTGPWLSNPSEPGKQLAVPNSKALRIVAPTVNAYGLRIDLPLRVASTRINFTNSDGTKMSEDIIVYNGALNCLDNKRGSMRLTRYFQVISQIQDSAGPILHLRVLDRYSCWFPASEVEDWDVTRCIISMDAAPRHALTAPGYREKQHSVALLRSSDKCPACLRAGHGWSWARRRSNEDPQTSYMTHTYLLKLEKRNENAHVGLIFLVAGEPSEEFNRVGLYDISTKDPGQALNSIWNTVQTNAKALMRGDEPRSIGGFWSRPLIEGTGPRARVSMRVPGCCAAFNMVATLFCGQTSSGHIEFAPELRLERIDKTGRRAVTF
ncbi:Vegetative incompatibility protein [Paramyrothecium foliicola]|nr:Vegetative incompatibility protein [Paramyrothecium foliicola]